MRAFQYHPLSKETVKEKLLFRMSIEQTAWVLAGLFLSMKMTEIVPKLPFSLIFAYIHYLIPLLVCAFFGFIEHKSGLSFLAYFLSYRRYKKRKKTWVNFQDRKKV